MSEETKAALAVLPLEDYVLKHEAWDQLEHSRKRAAEAMRERCAVEAEKHSHGSARLIAEFIRALEVPS